MAPQPPLLLVENQFDTVNQFPAATLTATSELTGREVFRIADGRRERSWWQTATTAANHAATVDHGSGNLRNADFLWLDRGHNLWGKQIKVDYSDNGSAWTTLVTLTVPASGTVGGDPTLTTMSATEEGALWSLFNAAGASHRYWRVLVVDNMAPIVPGVMLGRRTASLGYSKVKDEDEGERTQQSETSIAGYRATAKTYSWRMLSIDLGTINSTAYDTTVRTLRQQLFAQNNPVFAVMDYGTKPERGWLYQYDGTSWSAAQQRVYRSTLIRLREVGHVLG